MLTCRAHGVEALAWLKFILTALLQRPGDAYIGDLLPFNFTKKNQPEPLSKATQRLMRSCQMHRKARRHRDLAPLLEELLRRYKEW